MVSLTSIQSNSMNEEDYKILVQFWPQLLLNETF